MQPELKPDYMKNPQHLALLHIDNHIREYWNTWKKLDRLLSTCSQDTDTCWNLIQNINLTKNMQAYSQWDAK